MIWASAKVTVKKRATHCCCQKKSGTEILLRYLTVDVRCIKIAIDSQRQIGQPNSNSSRVRYIHLSAYTLGKFMNLISLPTHITADVGLIAGGTGS